MQKRAVTLVETLVSAVILAVVFGGLLATFFSVRNYVKRANKRLVSMNLIRHVANDLYKAVRADTWDSGDLQTGSHSNEVNVTIDNMTYTGNYTVTDLSGSGYDYRQVTINLNYP
jgi:type II secretory pathway pseudopilin PulG